MFVYGLYGLLTGRLIAHDLKDIEEKHYKLYSRLYGVLSILGSFICAALIYEIKHLKKSGQSFSPLQLVLVLLLIVDIIIFLVLKKRFKKGCG